MSEKEQQSKEKKELPKEGWFFETQQFDPISAPTPEFPPPPPKTSPEKKKEQP